MAKCPFCSSEISEHLAINGGTCPSCFGEIPGEEAPTDPGAVVRARQEKEDAKTVQRSRIPLVLALLGMTALLGGAAYMVTRPPVEIPVLDFDELEFEDYEITAMPDPDTEAPAVAPRPTSTAPRPTGLDALAGSDGPDINVGNGSDRVVDGGAGGTRNGTGGDDPMNPDIAIGGPSFGGDGFGEIEMGVRHDDMQGVVLTDDNDIIDMIRRVMQNNIPRLQTCYTRQLKNNESLRGNWRLEYTLLESGEASNITVVGQDMSDSTMEACIVGKVERWNFQPIKADQPIAKTLRFRPG